MVRYQSNKQAFFVAALIILLCLICLAGATLALFTTTARGGTIGVVTTTGDIEIDVVDTAGGSLQNLPLAFMTTKGAVDSDSVYFEPGACFYTQGFQIRNDGNIAINFSFTLSMDESIDKPAFDRAFELWIVEESDHSTAVPLSEYKWHLKAGEISAVYQLYVKMREDAGQEFQNQAYEGIGVTVCAVQGNVTRTEE